MEARNAGYIQGRLNISVKIEPRDVKPLVTYNSETESGRAGIRTRDCLTLGPVVFHLGVLLLPTCWNSPPTGRFIKFPWVFESPS